MKKDISNNLEVAKPQFLKFMKYIDIELFQYVQYAGLEADEENIFFLFKSSKNSLSFKIYGGVNVGNIEGVLSGRTTEIYNYFKALKLNN